MTESEHQILLMCWAKKISLAGRRELDLLFHIPNGGGRSKREAGILKAMGVKPGVSDMFLPVIKTFQFEIGGGVVKREVAGGLWIELKAETGKASEDQWKWIYAMRRNGYEAVVCAGWEEAAAQIRWYLGGDWPEVDMSEMVERMGGAKNG